MDILLDPLSVPEFKPLQHPSQLEEERRSPKQRQQWAVKRQQFGGSVLDVESEEEEASINSCSPCSTRYLGKHFVRYIACTRFTI